VVLHGHQWEIGKESEDKGWGIWTRHSHQSGWEGIDASDGLKIMEYKDTLSPGLEHKTTAIGIYLSGL